VQFTQLDMDWIATHCPCQLFSSCFAYYYGSHCLAHYLGALIVPYRLCPLVVPTCHLYTIGFLVPVLVQLGLFLQLCHTQPWVPSLDLVPYLYLCIPHSLYLALPLRQHLAFPVVQLLLYLLVLALLPPPPFWIVPFTVLAGCLAPPHAVPPHPVCAVPSDALHFTGYLFVGCWYLVVRYMPHLYILVRAVTCPFTFPRLLCHWFGKHYRQRYTHLTCRQRYLPPLKFLPSLDGLYSWFLPCPLPLYYTAYHLPRYLRCYALPFEHYIPYPHALPYAYLPFTLVWLPACR